MRIRDLTRDGDRLHYFLDDDRGNEVRQVEGEFPEIIAEAKRRRKGIEDVLAESLLVQVGKPDSRPIVVVQHEVGEHHHDERYLIGLPDHGHADIDSRLAEHGHSDLEARLGRLSEEARALEAGRQDLEHGMADALTAIEREHKAHRHPESAPTGHQHPHGHEELEQALHSLGSSFTALSMRLDEIASGLSAEVAAAVKQLTVHGHPELVHGHEHQHDYLSKLPEHPHPAYAEALAEHEAKSARKVELRVLSTEDVGGKRRLIVEEV